MNIVKTSCSFCHLSCGMNVHVRGGRAIKVDGMEEHPLNRGVLCPKGEAALEWACSPKRLKHPLRKQNGTWRRISWDEALDLLGDKLTEIGGENPRAFASAFGMSVLLSGSITPSLVRRFLYVYGSPNCFSVESMCYRCRLIGYMLTFGRFRVADPRNSSCILLWGHDPTNSSPPLATWILEAKEKGAKLIVIDPRRTPLAREADLYLQPRPGSDIALLLGLTNVIISEGLQHGEFVSRWTHGFDQLAEHVRLFTPEKVEQLTWVPARTVEEVARIYATTRPACIVQGTNALDQHASGLQNSRGIAILQALTGNVDIAGGFIKAPRLRTNVVEMPVRPKGKAIGQEEYPTFFGIFKREFGEGQTMLLPNVLLTGKPYPIKAMVIAGSNPLLTWPNSKKVEEALSKLDLLVVMTPFMSETAQRADLVLPAATFLERTELSDYYSLWGLPYVMLRKKVMEYHECWSDTKFWLELAGRMGYKEHFPWRSEEEVINFILEPSGLTVRYLTEEKPEGLLYGSVGFKEYESKGFPTPSGKVELYSDTLSDEGCDALPTWRESPESPLSSPELVKEYPLILTTGARHLEFMHSQLRDIPSLHQKVPEPLAEINPRTAAEYGIRNEETIIVETRRGRIELKAKVDDDIIPGVVSIPHGWAQANVNLLTDERPADPALGYPALKSLLCRIRKADCQDARV
jgi:anaerobic selenocysteine-containing dehydrogenase